MEIRLLFLLVLGLIVPVLVFSQDTASTSSKPTKKLDMKCVSELRKTPPIWVTDTGFDTEKDMPKEPKVNRNYVQGRYTLDNQKEKPMIVPKRSVVSLGSEFRSLVETQGDLEKNANKWVPIKVLSVPPENTGLKDSTSGKISEVAKSKFYDTAKVGAKGFLKLGDLERVEGQKNYVFIVKRDSELFRKLIDPRNPHSASQEVFALELHQKDGKFVVNRCCINPGNVCKDVPIFKAIGVKGKTGQDVLVSDPCDDCILKHLVPMQSEFAKPLQGLLAHPALGLEYPSALKKLESIDKLNFVDSRGFVQIPVVEIKGDKSGKLGPYNSYHHTAEFGDGDLYLKPETACGLMQVMKTWDEKYCPDGKPSCRIEFGDASHAFYTRTDSEWIHNDHDHGECIDVRPFDSKAKFPSGGRSFHSKNFNRADFGKLLGLFMQLGPSECYMNDKRLNTNYKGCKWLDGHSDHLHICFPRTVVDNKTGKSVPNQKLLNACQEGVK